MLESRDAIASKNSKLLTFIKMIKRNRTFVVKILFFFLVYYAVTILIGQNAQFAPSEEKQKYEYLEGEEVIEDPNNIIVPDEVKKVEPLQPAPEASNDESVDKEQKENVEVAGDKVVDNPEVEGT